MNRTIIAATTLAAATIAFATITAVTAVVPVHSATRCNQIAIIGDSLTALGNDALHAQFPKAIVNGRGRRYTAEGVEAASGIDASNNVDCWVFALGTNDLFGWHDLASSRTVINKMLAFVGPTDHVWWVLPDVTQASGLDAATFDSAVPTSAHPVDLHTPLNDFLDDGIHLTALGYMNRAASIATAVAG